MTKKFQKCKEDFQCAQCGEKIIGNGYTNHCPHCFYSKHVDINPGDRAATCGGLMPVIRVEYEQGIQILVHQCLKCRQIKRNKISQLDNAQNLAIIIEHLAKQ